MHLHAACPHAIPNNRPRRKHFGALRDCVFCVQLHVMRKRTYHPLERKNLGHFAQDTPCATIHNLVGTTSLHCSTGDIDLDHIHAMLPNTFYDKSRFAAITIRIFNPSTTALLFTSGKLVLTGAVSWLECLLASLHIARILSRVCPGSRFCVVDTQVQNIVGNAVVPLERHQMLDLRALYADHSTIATWQPSMFPGLVLRQDACPVVLLLFFSGRVVITGGRTERDIHDGWAMLWPLVKQYVRKGHAMPLSSTPRKRRRASSIAESSVTNGASSKKSKS
jgi:transcription initiation factor TFIID TATA-box-binding protein